MLVSIITPVLNGIETIEECIVSIHHQTYKNIQHIVVDGGSNDGTVDIIKKHSNKISCWKSESDSGLFAAINKGIALSDGDIIGVLNSDDLYSSAESIEHVVNSFLRKEVDSCYGDLVYIDKINPKNIIRYWKSGEYRRKRFIFGWMPPHPTFFVKKAVYKKYGMLSLDFPLAADYELMLRLLYKYEITTSYIPEILVKMRVGGISRPGLYTIKAIMENYRAWKVNDLAANPITFILKPMSKVRQYLHGKGHLK